MSRKFDRFMVDVHISANPKIARLNPAERWCFVGGILSLAALAPVRGCLLIGDHPAEPADIASHARVSIAVARSALEKLRRVGMIVRDEDLDCERVHDFDDWNPAPKNDPTNAERQQRYRDRRRSRNGTVTPVTPVTVTTPEVEGKRRQEEEPPRPPASGGSTIFPSAPKSINGKRQRDLARHRTKQEEHRLAVRSFVAEHFPGEHPDAIFNTVAVLTRHRIEPTADRIREHLAAAREELEELSA